MKRAALVSAAVIAAVVSCTPVPPEQAEVRASLEVFGGDLEAIRERGRLRILVPTLREVHLPRVSAPGAEDREMVRTFSARLGLDAEFVVIESRSELLDLLEEGYGDLGLAQLTVTPSRVERFLFTHPTEMVSEWLVGRRGEPNNPRSLEGLDGREVHVRASSSFGETLSRIAEEEGVAIRIVHVEESLDTETIAYEVSRGQRPLTVIDSNLLRSIETYNNELEPLLELASRREIAWAVRKEAKDLAAAADSFIFEHHFDFQRRRWLSEVEKAKDLARGLVEISATSAKRGGAEQDKGGVERPRYSSLSKRDWGRRIGREEKVLEMPCVSGV